MLFKGIRPGKEVTPQVRVEIGGRRSRPALIRLFALAMLLSTSVLGAGWALVSHNAEAGRSGCRHDPLVYLSNGAVVQITAVIDAPPSRIKHISYTLHAPRGTSVSHIVYPGGPHIEQSFNFIDDTDENVYVSETTAFTHDNGIRVRAQMRVGPRADSTSGFDGDELSIELTR